MHVQHPLLQAFPNFFGWIKPAGKIGGEEGSDLRAELFRLVAQKGWQLRELTREVSSLEDFFVQITYKQNVGQ